MVRRDWSCTAPWPALLCDQQQRHKRRQQEAAGSDHLLQRHDQHPVGLPGENQAVGRRYQSTDRCAGQGDYRRRQGSVHWKHQCSARWRLIVQRYYGSLPGYVRAVEVLSGRDDHHQWMSNRLPRLSGHSAAWRHSVQPVANWIIQGSYLWGQEIPQRGPRDHSCRQAGHWQGRTQPDAYLGCC